MLLLLSLIIYTITHHQSSSAPSIIIYTINHHLHHHSSSTPSLIIDAANHLSFISAEDE